MFLLLIQILAFYLFPLPSTSLDVPPLMILSRFHHNITVPSLGELRINCFLQPPLPAKRLPRAQIQDCYTGLQVLLVGDKALAPMHFTEDKRTGFKVPFAWGHDSCQIIINNLTPDADDTFPIVLIAHLAAEVTEACIVEQTASLGGDVKLGHDQFEVIVAGTGVKNGDQGVARSSGTGNAVAVGRRGLPFAVPKSW
ncbi:MAG: hypothetical protein Q9170_005630 [Blastenia crenularia]